MTIPIYLLHKLEHLFQPKQKPAKTKKIHKKKHVRICSQPEYIFYTTYLPEELQN